MFWQPSFHTRAFISSSVQLHDTRRVVSTSSSERVESLWKDTLVNRDKVYLMGHSTFYEAKFTVTK